VAKAGNSGSTGRKSRDEATWPGAGEETGLDDLSANEPRCELHPTVIA